MKINEFFQKGYYINLDRRPDRKVEFEAEMKKAGLEGFFERVRGIDGVNEPAELKKHNYCGATFARIFKMAQKAGYERFIIFEDDAQFYDRDGISAIEIVEKALDQIQQFPDWHMLYFGCYTFGKELQQVSENLLKANEILTLHACGYNSTGMKKFLEYDPFFHCPVDGWLGERLELNKYVAYPLAVIQRESKSDLDAWGFAPNPHHWETNFIKGKIIKQF